MKASELRIGNYYNQFGNAEKVSWSTLKTLEESTTEQLWCKPIPLTEEWLLKFGFEKKLNCSNMIYYILAGKCLLEYNLTHNIADIVKKVHLDLFIEIEYVHQLQNLYFALTNEELTYEQQK